MKILQVQFKTAMAHPARIDPCPTPRARHSLWSSARLCRQLSGYKSMYTHLSRAGSAGHRQRPVDFYGNGESDGEFEDMSFDGLHTDAQDIFAWAAEQLWTAKSCSSLSWAALPPPAHRSSSPTA